MVRKLKGNIWLLWWLFFSKLALENEGVQKMIILSQIVRAKQMSWIANVGQFLPNESIEIKSTMFGEN